MQNKTNFEIYEHNDNESRVIYCLACVFTLIEKKITDYLRAYNLSPSQFNALMIIKHIGKEQGLSQIEIGEKLIITASNMTRLIDKLTDEKLIERIPQANDRRVNLIKITDKGSAVLDNIWPGYHKIIKELSEKLNAEELAQISDLLFKWFNNLTSV